MDPKKPQDMATGVATPPADTTSAAMPIDDQTPPVAADPMPTGMGSAQPEPVKPPVSELPAEEPSVEEPAAPMMGAEMPKKEETPGTGGTPTGVAGM